MNIEIPIKYHNSIDVTVKNIGTGAERKLKRSYNTVTQFYLDAVGGFTAGTLSYIKYGSGTGTPALSDTALFNEVGLLNATRAISIDWTTGIAKAVFVATVEAGVSTDTTITEVGLSGRWAGGKIINHCMLSEPITKKDLDIVTFTITLYFISNPGFVYNNGQVKLHEKFIRFALGDICSYGYNRLEWGFTSTFYTNSVDVVNSSLSNPQVTNIPQANITESFNTVNGLTMSCRLGATDLNTKPHTVKRVTVNKWGWYYDRTVYGTPAFDIYFNAGSDFVPADDMTLVKENIGIGNGVDKDFGVAWEQPYDLTLYADDVAVPVENYTFDENTRVESEIVSFMTVNEFVSDTGNHFLAGANATNNKIGDYTIFTNPYAAYGTNTIMVMGALDLYYMDVNDTWQLVGTGTVGQQTVYTVPADGLAAEKFKVICGVESNQCYIQSVLCNKFTPDIKTIHFPAPLSEGTVLTATYKTTGIPKVEDTVLDVTINLKMDTERPPV